MRLPIDVDMMPTQLDSDRLEEEDLDGTLDVLLAKREEIFDKVEKNIRCPTRKKVALLDIISSACSVGVLMQQFYQIRERGSFSPL